MIDMNLSTLDQAIEQNFLNGTLERAVRMIGADLDIVSSAALEEAANRIAAAARAARPPEPNPAGEALYRERRAIDPTGADDDSEAGTLTSLTATATMLETYSVEAFPANDQGQVHFGRVLMESAASVIRAYIATLAA